LSPDAELIEGRHWEWLAGEVQFFRISQLKLETGNLMTKMGKVADKI
jgi:hypothetical protein